MKFMIFSVGFALIVYLAWAIDWDAHPPVPSYWELLDNVQTEAAKNEAAYVREVCSQNPRHRVCH